MERGQVDMGKPITELPDCGVEGCNNKGWIGLKEKFVCGQCILRLSKIESDAVFEKLKIK